MLDVVKFLCVSKQSYSAAPNALWYELVLPPGHTYSACIVDVGSMDGDGCKSLMLSLDGMFYGLSLS